ncbi:MAG: DUF58 domain-containing protein [bacterium]|nr:DUF58 domain-containing protein [bacterium]
MINAKELLKRVREVEIRTRGIVRNSFTGQYHSVFRGRGVTFREVRDYVPGDDIRDVDWNVSARMNHPYVKTFEEDRELTVLLLVDVSSSLQFGTSKQWKSEIAAEIAAILAFSAIRNNDKVGLLLFSDQVERYLPPKKGRSHAFRVLTELVEFEPKHARTELTSTLLYVDRILRQRSILFLLSDFQSEGYSDALRKVASRHDLVAVHLLDQWEEKLPKLGWLKVFDAETKQETWLNTNSIDVRNKWKSGFLKQRESVVETLKKARVDRIEVTTDQDVVPVLTNFFHRRGHHR